MIIVTLNPSTYRRVINVGRRGGCGITIPELHNSHSAGHTRSGNAEREGGMIIHGDHVAKTNAEAGRTKTKRARQPGFLRRLCSQHRQLRNGLVDGIMLYIDELWPTCEGSVFTPRGSNGSGVCTSVFIHGSEVFPVFCVAT